MSKDITEIRFHGRGGQGAKTAAELLADAALESGKYIQSFPEYGAERQGAPMKAFTRISDKQIVIHCGVTNPNIVAVVDPTLIYSIPVTEGLDENGLLIVNTDLPAQDVRKILGWKGRLIVLNATKIALDELGRPVTNTAMLGALLKGNELVPFDSMKEIMKSKLTAKIGGDLAERNIKALERAHNEAQVDG